MKSKLLLITAACALLCGCVEKPTYEMAKNVQAKYPGCELSEANDIVPRFYARTADGRVILVQFSEDTGAINHEWVIFGPNHIVSK